MNTPARMRRFNVVGTAGIGVQLGALWFLTDLVHVHYLFATPAAIGAAVTHNFFWHWAWTWRDRAEAGRILTAFARFAVANGVVSLAGNLGVMATLVSGAHVAPVAANGAAICVCGLLNYWLGDAFVFRRGEDAAGPHGRDE
jgi:putative flippase GtrA